VAQRRQHVCKLLRVAQQPRADLTPRERSHLTILRIKRLDRGHELERLGFGELELGVC